MLQRRRSVKKRLWTFLIMVALVAGMVGCVDLVMFEIDPNSGEIRETTKLTSQDETLTVTIPEGTVALDKDGNPLLTLRIDNDADPPAPPEDAHIIGIAYDLDPAGATFYPAMTLTWKYSPPDIPEGVGEEDLVMAYYDEATGEWVILECVVNTATNIITASVSHLTTFAVLAVPPVQYDLTISSTAGGNVTIPGEGTSAYDEGTLINLAAQPDEGYQFGNWTGDVGTIANVNAASTTIMVEGNYAIIANFEVSPPAQYSLTIARTAGGLVTVPGEGTFMYDAGTVVSLVANPLNGYYFVSWTGNVSTVANVNAASTTITMTDNCSITANFKNIPVTYYTLTMAVNGSGSTSPSVGQHTYAAGTVVSITATAASCYRFINWTGDVGTVGNVNTASTTIRMNGAYSITANFEQEEPLYFADPNLEAAIREAIDKPTGPICPSDLKGLTTLHASARNITDLTGLEHCTSLTILVLIDNQISDISALAGLTNLTYLHLDSNQISDLSPLANLTSVMGLRLVLRRNQISDISPLANLTNLIELDLAYNQVSDISPLASLINLLQLQLHNNQISDISSLANLTSLTYLILHNNQISDISPLANLTSLTIYLNLDNNQISDISPLANLTSLTVLDIRTNQISNISPLANLTSLAYLHLDNNQISDISPLANLTSLTYLILNSNQISDISPLIQNEGLSTGDWVSLESNPLNSDSINIYIPQLEARGVDVDY